MEEMDPGGRQACMAREGACGERRDVVPEVVDRVVYELLWQLQGHGSQMSVSSIDMCKLALFASSLGWTHSPEPSFEGLPLTQCVYGTVVV